jgi:hypothetical protein
MRFRSAQSISIDILMTVCILVAFCAQAFSISNDRPREIVNQVREALGGNDALNSIRSLSAIGDFHSRTAFADGRFELYMLFPEKLMRVLKCEPLSGTKIIYVEALNGGQVWTNSKMKMANQHGGGNVFNSSARANSKGGMGRGGGPAGGMSGGPPGGMGEGGLNEIGGLLGQMAGSMLGGMGGDPSDGTGNSPPSGDGSSGPPSGMRNSPLSGGDGPPSRGGRSDEKIGKAFNEMAPSILANRNSEQIIHDFFCLLIAFLPHVRNSLRIETNNDIRFNIKLDVNTDFLKFSKDGGPAIALAINQKTHLPIAASYCLNDADENQNPNSTAVQIFFSEYRKVPGKKGVHMLLPHQIVKIQNGQTVERMHIKKYQLNRGLKPEQFEKK